MEYHNYWSVCVNPFKMYPVKRGSLDSVHVYGSQQLPQLFVGDVYGIREQIEKMGVEVDTT